MRLAAAACSLVLGCASSGGGPLPEPIAAGAAAHAVDPIDLAAVSRIGDRIVIAVRAVTGKGPVSRIVTVEIVDGWEDLSDDRIDVLLPTGFRTGGRPAGHFASTYSGGLRGAISWAESTAVLRVETRTGDGELIAERLVGSDTMVVAHQEGEAPAQAGVAAGFDDLLNLVLTVPELDALLMDIARRPPIWKLLSGHIEVGLGLHLDTLRTLPSGHTAVDARLDANGSLALQGEVQLTTKSSPYLLTAGVMRIEAHHPTRPERRVVLDVIGATRGQGPPLIEHRTKHFTAPDDSGRVQHIDAFGP